MLSRCASRLQTPRSSAARSGAFSSALDTPPLYLSARTVATSTMQSGERPALRHLMSMNFSAPKVRAEAGLGDGDDPPSFKASLVACTLLQPCAILANGPPCIRQGVPSSVCTRLGLIASFISAVIAPSACRSRAIDWLACVGIGDQNVTEALFQVVQVGG